MTKPLPTPDFAVWKFETLVQFAKDACVEMRRQAEYIQQLEEERRVAIRAYRALMQKGENDTRS